jgi:hypothetical protein
MRARFLRSSGSWQSPLRRFVSRDFHGRRSWLYHLAVLARWLAEAHAGIRDGVRRFYARGLDVGGRLADKLVGSP